MVRLLKPNTYNALPGRRRARCKGGAGLWETFTSATNYVKCALKPVSVIGEKVTILGTFKNPAALKHPCLVGGIAYRNMRKRSSRNKKNQEHILGK